MLSKEYDEPTYDIVGCANDRRHAQGAPLGWKLGVDDREEVATPGVLVASGRLKPF